MPPEINSALIPAAGRGQRLDYDKPKPLVEINGIPLIGWNLQILHSLGLEQFTVVTGYQGDQIEEALRDRYPDMGITFVRNEDWKQGQALSVLSGQGHVSDPFLLLMSDHLFSPGIFRSLLEPPSMPVKLAVDYEWKDVFDLDDAMLVNVEDGLVLKMDKQLDNFNAVDTGLFACDQRLFDGLEWAIEQSGSSASLSDGMQWIMDEHQLETVDVSHGHWIDVDTQKAYRHAESLVESGTFHLIDE